MSGQVNKKISYEEKIEELAKLLYYNAEAVAYDDDSNEHGRECPCFSADEPDHKQAFESLAKDLLETVESWRES